MADTTTPYLDRDALVRGVRAARWRGDDLVSPAGGVSGYVDAGAYSASGYVSAGLVDVSMAVRVPGVAPEHVRRMLRRVIRAALLDAVRHYASQEVPRG